MSKYGYLDEYGYPRPVKRVVLGDLQIFNPSEEQLTEAGFKPIEYVDRPEDEDGFYFTSAWEEIEGVIKQLWTKHENPVYPEPEDDLWTKFTKILIGKESSINYGEN